MTPEQARRLLEYGDETEVEYHALHTIADMTAEHCIEIQVEPGDPWQKVTMWHPGNPLRPGHTLATNERIRTRYVTKPQPLGDQP